MYVNQELSCCGWVELSDLADYCNFQDTMRLLLTDYELINRYDTTCGAVLFTANEPLPNYASRFARQLRAHKLGKVITVPVFRNPNTGRYIHSYVWLLHKENVIRYAKKLIKATNKSNKDWGY